MLQKKKLHSLHPPPREKSEKGLIKTQRRDEETVPSSSLGRRRKKSGHFFVLLALIFVFFSRTDAPGYRDREAVASVKKKTLLWPLSCLCLLFAGGGKAGRGGQKALFSPPLWSSHAQSFSLRGFVQGKKEWQFRRRTEGGRSPPPRPQPTRYAHTEAEAGRC